PPATAEAERDHGDPGRTARGTACAEGGEAAGCRRFLHRLPFGYLPRRNTILCSLYQARARGDHRHAQWRLTLQSRCLLAASHHSSVVAAQALPVSSLGPALDEAKPSTRLLDRLSLQLDKSKRGDHFRNGKRTKDLLGSIPTT